MAAALLEQRFWETFCDLIDLEPELHGDEKSLWRRKLVLPQSLRQRSFMAFPDSRQA